MVKKQNCVTWIPTVYSYMDTEEVELPDGSNSVWYVPDYFDYIIKSYKTFINNPPTKIYVNKIENRITFKIKTDTISNS